ncbi:hypothetical protein [Jannaschia sp. R86511]
MDTTLDILTALALACLILGVSVVWFAAGYVTALAHRNANILNALKRTNS